MLGTGLTRGKDHEGETPNLPALNQLRSLVKSGEGLHLEFKRKAAFPEKIVRELIAFANTSGGVLLLGVNDDGEIPGLAYPEEESLAVRRAIRKFSRPVLFWKEWIIPLSRKKFVIHYHVPQSRRRPHVFKLPAQKSETFVRINDMTVKASDEMYQIIRLGRHPSNIQFTYGPHESTLMRYLDQHPNISLRQFQELTGLDKTVTSNLLITLVLAHVIRITPTEKGDLYSRIG